MAIPTLTLSVQPESIDVDQSITIEVLTNAEDFQVESNNGTLSVKKVLTDEANKANKSFILTGVQEGDPGKITVSVTVDGQQKNAEFFCQCTLQPTTLEVGELTQSLRVGETAETTINTNAGDYTVEFSNKNVMRVKDKQLNKLVLEAIGIGSTTVEITATKRGAASKTVKKTVESTKAIKVDTEDKPASITFVNPTTKRKVTLVATNTEVEGFDMESLVKKNIILFSRHVEYFLSIILI